MLGKSVKFIGRPSLVFMALGIVTGVLIVGAEAGFAFALQAFLKVIGVASAELQIPNWVPQQSFSEVLYFIISFALIRGALQWAQTYLSSAALEKQNLLQRSRIIDWAFRSQSASSAEVMSLYVSCTNAIGAALQNLQIISIQLPAAFLFWIGLMIISPAATLTATALLTGLGLVLRLLDRRIGRLGVEAAQHCDRAYNQVLRNIKNLLLMHIYGTQVQESREVRGTLAEYCNSMLRFFQINSLKATAPSTVGVLLICVMTWVARSYSEISSVMLVSYFYLFLRFVQAFSELVKNASNLVFVWPQVDRLANWWASHSFDGVRNRRESADLSSARPYSDAVGWRLKNVTFRYQDAESDTLSHLNLDISPGETLVVTGPSGAGKSTLISLLLGNLLPSSGELVIFDPKRGELSFSTIEKASLLRSVGYVGAESFLIEGTIRENLVYGLSDPVNEAEIIEVLERAECQFVFQLNRGLEHRLTEQGQGLSAGQKQRLSLARALLRRPKVLILDEATANLDLKTERRLIETLRSLKGSITIVAVTHRQMLLEIADRRIELDDNLIT